MILRNQLAQLLVQQDLDSNDVVFSNLLDEQQESYLKKADEIINLIVNSIKSIEFKICKKSP